MTDAKPYMDICEQLSRENSLLRDANANLEQGLEIKQRFIVALEKRIECLQWLIANGERVFGSLWKEASQADIQLMMEKSNEHKSI